MPEDSFLETLFGRLGTPPGDVVIPPGDDCAALRLDGGRLLLVAVDQVVGGRHYADSGPTAATPEQIGRKLLARNLSDIAAMGGQPRYCLVATGFGPHLDQRWLLRFFDGIVGLGREYGVRMIGGDLARTPTDTVASLTILGDVAEESVCTRSGARPGDALLVTGRFGRSLPTGHHLSFVPRCREGAWLAQTRKVHAMMDVSDGLLLDTSRVCRASGVGVRLDPAAVPRRTAETSTREALTDGEDYELIVAVPGPVAGELLAAWPFPEVPLTRIGEFHESPGVCDLAGAALAFGVPAGFDHFAMPGDPETAAGGVAPGR